MPGNSDHSRDADAGAKPGSAQRPRAPAAKAPRGLHGLDPSEFGEYGMHSQSSVDAVRDGKRPTADQTTGVDPERMQSAAPGNAQESSTIGILKDGSYGSSDHGAESDHQSFDAEYRIREERNQRPRSLPTGLSATSDDAPASDTPGTGGGTGND